MFKKLKDKLAEEVKSSPQRIQQFAQAAQAAVTSASSSISDITNSDLFSIGDSDTQISREVKLTRSPNSQLNTYEDSSPGNAMDLAEYSSGHDIIENQRQRRLSNSSFASDISFRLPSYETPSMYHLQSDMEVSASEAEERGFSGNNVSLERVTKEQLYAAYRRTQERYKKYRTQYGDLARHYKLLEKENAKARSVLVETQDKALRRISELKEQCALEQSAKAHLEKSLRIDIEEKNMKIDALNTKIQVLQNNTDLNKLDKIIPDQRQCENVNEVQLINLSNESESKTQADGFSQAEVTLNLKIEKMEQLINKYKESLKASKDKNLQLASELQKLSSEIEHKNKEIDNLKTASNQLQDANLKIQEVMNKNEELHNKINTFDFSKSKEVSTLEIDLQRANDEIEELKSKIAVFSKREEEYAISLAENKLSIHKELENKEAEIKSLKDSLSTSKKEIQSLNIVIDEYKLNLKTLEEEQSKLNNVNSDFNIAKSKISDLESSNQEITKKYSQLENTKSKLEEDYKLLELQHKQETAEKLAMIDRNTYLENRNTQISEENLKKSSYIGTLENELHVLKEVSSSKNIETDERNEIVKELNIWKTKYEKLESEIQEERIELVKLQSEIEKLITNHELIQSQNTEFRDVVTHLKTENDMLQKQVIHYNGMKNTCKKLVAEINDLQQLVKLTSKEANILQKSNCETLLSFNQQINEALNQFINNEIKLMTAKHDELSLINDSLQNDLVIASRQHEAVINEICTIQQENEVLKTNNEKLKLDVKSLNEQNASFRRKIEETAQDIENKTLCIDKLNSQIKDLENKCNSLGSSFEIENSKQLELIEKIEALGTEKSNLLESINSINELNKSLKSQIGKLELDHETRIEQLLQDNHKINEELVEKINNLNSKNILINHLEEKNKILTEENISLEKKVKDITTNLKNFESEINEIKVSHEALESEKNRLSNMIEKAEKNRTENSEQLSKETKSVNMIENKILNEEVATLEVSEQNYLQNVQLLTSQNIEKGDKYENDFSNKYASLKTDYDVLREENKRLLSDIEGLQAYLSKISKENSTLNDKLRELIASSENSTENDTTNNVKDLNTEVQIGKEKIENLIRENTLLIEENLELKDQLQAHNYTKSMDIQSSANNENVEINDFKEKYNALLQINSQLEHKLLDSENVNKSVNMDMQQIQEKNEKLRFSNEKLERRLDEALVSLRHLHSLQENTELEYLRNILYEYLTGSGTHSVTLAKVLSAIVKFDDMQTQQVLLKEKERQGFLRQLGII